MNILGTLRGVSAATVAGSIIWVGAEGVITKDTEGVKAKESKHSIPFYLAVGGVPTWLLLRALDEKNQAQNIIPEEKKPEEPPRTIFDNWREVDKLTLNNKHKEAIPVAIHALLTQEHVSQSECVRVAGVCLLGGRYDIYDYLTKIMPAYATKKTLNAEEKEYLTKAIKT